MIFLNLFILLNCLINLSISQEEEPIVTKSYDYLLLELTWPVTFCFNTNCSKIPKNFSIHGFWPNKWNKKLVTYCADYSINENFEEQIRPIAYRLTQAWPALKRGDDLEFWRYQMNKHGYCFIPQQGIRSYFEIALNVFDDLNLENILTQLNYVPGNRLYDTISFFEDLKQNFGAIPVIKCLNQKNGPALLKNINFCFDKRSLRLIDCNDGNKCKNNFIIPYNL